MATLLLLTSCSHTQTMVDADCLRSDMKHSLIDSALGRIAYGLTSIDYGYQYPNADGYPGIVMLIPNFDRRSRTPLVIEIKKISVLAWQVKQIGPLLMTYSALIWSHYINTDSTEEWALLVLSSDDADDQRWVASKRGDEPLMRYSHAPTNEDVTAFMNQLNGIEGRVLDYDKNRKYDWEGVEVTFIEGLVCKSAWEGVIGEKPTKFFPK